MSAATLGAGMAGLLAGGVLAVPIRRSIAAAPPVDVGAPAMAGGSTRRLVALLAVLCGLAFALTAWRFGWSPELPAYLYFVATGLALSAVDLATHRLPNRVTLPSYLVGGGLLAGSAVVRGEGAPLVRALLAMVVLLGFYWLAALPGRNGIGGGDVKLAGVVGLYLGYLGWAEVMVGTLLALGYGSLVGLLLIAVGRAGRGTRLALGPYLVAGALTAILAARPIVHGYVGLVGG
jgi:leader peptidase (prepilin peptidase) / N-methyltransferase